jgi:hypothetical protein
MVKKQTTWLRSQIIIRVYNTTDLAIQTGKIKCERAISLADCFCLALAHKTFCSALFAKREKGNFICSEN